MVQIKISYRGFDCDAGYNGDDFLKMRFTAFVKKDKQAVAIIYFDEKGSESENMIQILQQLTLLSHEKDFSFLRTINATSEACTCHLYGNPDIKDMTEKCPVHGLYLRVQHNVN